MAMDTNSLILIAGVVTALAGAVIGNLLLIRRMSLVADSMPHIALPGIGLGVLFHINPLWAAMAFLLLAVIVIWTVRFKTSLELDSIIGVLFVTSLALGSVLAQGDAELLEAFFGDVTKITQAEALIVITLGLIVLGITWSLRRALLLSAIEEEVAESIGIPTKKIEFLFLLLVALTIAAGINFVGVLLMSALLIIPSVAGRTVAGKSLATFFGASSVVGILSTLIGLTQASRIGLEPGILIVFVAAGFFVLSLIISVLKK